MHSQAIQDNCLVIFLDSIRKVRGDPKYSLAWESHLAGTIYGCKFLSCIVSEAHSVQKFNKMHTALYMLRCESKSMITMTATPVMTKLQVSHHLSQYMLTLLTIHPSLQDLWIMGHTMGILPFRNKVKFDNMKKELNYAQVKDWKMECESALAEEQLHGLFEGMKITIPCRRWNCTQGSVNGCHSCVMGLQSML